ncbi:MAG: hypothetical protein WCG04_05260 [Alphaproteobacteria bacterium]
MIQFWQLLIIIASVGLSSGACLAANAHDNPRVAMNSTGESVGRQDNLKILYHTINNFSKTCNANRNCQQRETCQAWIQKLLTETLEKEGNALNEADMNLILAEAYELAITDVFYSGVLAIKDAMSPRGWQNYKAGHRIASTYMSDLARVSVAQAPTASQVPTVPLDVDADAILSLLLQAAIPDGERVCVVGEQCYDYNKIMNYITKIISELREIRVASSEATRKTLSGINERIAKIITIKEGRCPSEILQAIRSRLYPVGQQQLDQELKPFRSLSGGGGIPLTNKELFDKEIKDASGTLQITNPAAEGTQQANKNVLLQQMYSVVAPIYNNQNQCPGGDCLSLISQGFKNIKAAMNNPRDPRQAVVDFYLNSMKGLVNSVVYRGELFIKDQYPAVWDRYKSGARIDAGEYTKRLQQWSTAIKASSNAVSGTTKKPDKKLQFNRSSIAVNRDDVVAILLQYLIEEEERCQGRNAWGAAASRAVQKAKSALNSVDLEGSREAVASLDFLLKDMEADAQRELPLIIANAIRRELSAEEQGKLAAEVALKDKASFNREMAGASRDFKYIHPVPNVPTYNAEGEAKSKESEFKDKLTNKTQELGFSLLEKVFKVVTDVATKAQ